MQPNDAHRIEASRRAVHAALQEQFALDPEMKGKQAACTGGAAALFAETIAIFQSLGKTPSDASNMALLWWKTVGDQFFQLGANIKRAAANDPTQEPPR